MRCLGGKRSLPIALVVTALYASLFAAPALAAPSSVSPAVARRLISAIRAEMRVGQMPGAIVAIKRDGRPPWIVARGVANLLSRAPMLTNEHFRIGSVTKPFVTTLLLQLVQQRRLSLDDPISRYVAGVPGGDQITLRMLANMTSGLADLFKNPAIAEPLVLNEPLPPERLVQLGVTLPPLFAPGTKWSYSNTNTDLLGLVIQKVTGQQLATALRERVFKPLGLRGSSLPSTSALPRPYPNGYTVQTINDRLGDATFNTPTLTWAAGGMVSTIPDLLRAARMFGTGQPLLSPATQRVRERWVRFPPNSKIQQYGLGVFSFNGWIGHNGGIPGYTAIAWYLPQQRMSLVVSVNSDIRVGPTKDDYAYEPASEIAHVITKIISPRHVAPLAVKVGGSRVTSVT
jgi:D-alanyl-D-alanine carboxypeptidase